MKTWKTQKQTVMLSGPTLIDRGTPLSAAYEELQEEIKLSVLQSDMITHQKTRQ